jgi:hypothetical protein
VVLLEPKPSTTSTEQFLLVQPRRRPQRIARAMHTFGMSRRPMRTEALFEGAYRIGHKIRHSVRVL